MDKRNNALSIPQQLELRKVAVDDVLAHPEWSLAQAVRHLKKTMRPATAEMAKLSGVAYRTMQDIEQERSEGSVQTMNRIFGMLGLKLAVAKVVRDRTAEVGLNLDRDEDSGPADQGLKEEVGAHSLDGHAASAPRTPADPPITQVIGRLKTNENYSYYTGPINPP